MNKVIHLSTEANLTGFTYSQVYAGGSGAAIPVVLNNTTVNMTPSSTIDLVVTSISGATDVYLIGVKKIGLPPQIL